MTATITYTDTLTGPEYRGLIDRARRPKAVRKVRWTRSPGQGAYLESQGFRPGTQSALAAGLGEAAGGALFALGLATPAGGAAIVGTMGVAAAVHAPQGFFATEGGMEYPAVLALMAGALTLIGPGNISLDQLLSGRLDRPWMRAAALAAAAAALAAVLTKRQRALAEQAALADQEASA